MLSEKFGDRRLVLVISERRDRGSKAKATDVLMEAQRNNITIYTVTYSAYITPFTTKASDLGPQWNAPFNPLAMVTEVAHLAKENIGVALAEYTGGRHVGFSTLHRLEDDFASIGKEVHSLMLAYLYAALRCRCRVPHDFRQRARPTQAHHFALA